MRYNGLAAETSPTSLLWTTETLQNHAPTCRLMPINCADSIGPAALHHNPIGGRNQRATDAPPIYRARSNEPAVDRKRIRNLMGTASATGPQQTRNKIATRPRKAGRTRGTGRAPDGNRRRKRPATGYRSRSNTPAVNGEPIGNLRGTTSATGAQQTRNRRGTRPSRDNHPRHLRTAVRTSAFSAMPSARTPMLLRPPTGPRRPPRSCCKIFVSISDLRFEPPLRHLLKA
jgi:hypothetical protein